MEGIGNGFAEVLFGLFIFGVLVGVVGRCMTDENKISSAKRIEPKIELIINNNQVDTLFVYELK